MKWILLIVFAVFINGCGKSKCDDTREIGSLSFNGYIGFDFKDISGNYLFTEELSRYTKNQINPTCQFR